MRRDLATAGMLRSAAIERSSRTMRSAACASKPVVGSSATRSEGAPREGGIEGVGVEGVGVEGWG